MGHNPRFKVQGGGRGEGCSDGRGWTANPGGCSACTWEARVPSTGGLVGPGAARQGTLRAQGAARLSPGKRRVGGIVAGRSHPTGSRFPDSGSEPNPDKLQNPVPSPPTAQVARDMWVLPSTVWPPLSVAPVKIKLLQETPWPKRHRSLLGDVTFRRRPALARIFPDTGFATNVTAGL